MISHANGQNYTRTRSILSVMILVELQQHLQYVHGLRIYSDFPRTFSEQNKASNISSPEKLREQNQQDITCMRTTSYTLCSL